MPKTARVLVASLDSQLEFTIQSSTSGLELFEKSAKALGIRETWFFGLQCINAKGIQGWLALDKKVLNQNLKKECPIKLNFIAKYFPEDATAELILPFTKQYFFIQVKNNILNETYFCPPETGVLLASYALQAKYGPYDPKIHTPEFLANEKLLPERIIKQHSLSKEQWDKQILVWYSEHNNMDQETAMEEYLKVAQDLEMYGMSYFNIKNKKGTELLLGVDALGINVYNKGDKIVPKLGFPWQEVKKVSYSGKKFILKPIDPKSPNFTFLVNHSSINKTIIGLCKGNYEFYANRRKPDSIEKKQMRIQAEDERKQKQNQRNLLIKEREERILAEKNAEELREKIAAFQRENEEKERLMNELRFKLDELERVKLELSEKQTAADEAWRMATEEKEERFLKEEEAKEVQRMLEFKKQEAEMKEKEALRLAEELEEAKSKILIIQKEKEEQEEEFTQKLMNAAIDDSRIQQNKNIPGIKIMLDDEELKQQKQLIGELKQKQEDWIHNHQQLENVLDSNEHFDVKTQVYNDNEDNNENESLEFERNLEGNERSEEERVTSLDQNKNISYKLQQLRSELDKSKVNKEFSKQEQIYIAILKEGRDKYKTLKQIRQGNTKMRVETFESL